MSTTTSTPTEVLNMKTKTKITQVKRFLIQFEIRVGVANTTQHNNHLKCACMYAKEKKIPFHLK